MQHAYTQTCPHGIYWKAGCLFCQIDRGYGRYLSREPHDYSDMLTCMAVGFGNGCDPYNHRGYLTWNG